MPRSIERGLGPGFGGEGGAEGAAEREYRVELSDNDWATINYLALDRIEQEADFINRAERSLKGRVSLQRSKDVPDSPNLETSWAEERSALNKRRLATLALNDMLVRWREAGAPVTAKEEKSSSSALAPYLPASWREGIGTWDPRDYPQDGSLRMLKKVHDGIGDDERSVPQTRAVVARPEDWQRVRGLLQEAQGVNRKRIGGPPGETYVDMSSFGRSYVQAAQAKKTSVDRPEPWTRFRVISYGEQPGQEITDQEAMEMVNSRLEEIESRLPR